MRHPFDAEVEFLDGWTVLAAWGVLTSRVRLAMLVSNVIYRNPALLARQAVAVDYISAGRLDLGRLLRGVCDDYEGRRYSVREAAMSSGPVQQPRPPIVLAANRPRMLGLAARHADTWNTWGGYGLDAETLLSLTAERVDLVNRLCDKCGSDPATLRRSVLVHHSAFDRSTRSHPVSYLSLRQE